MNEYLRRVAQARRARARRQVGAAADAQALHRNRRVACCCARRRSRACLRWQAVRVALPELGPPPFGFGKHRVSVWRKYDVAPARAWEVLSDWHAPYITGSGTGAYASSPPPGSRWPWPRRHGGRQAARTPRGHDARAPAGFVVSGKPSFAAPTQFISNVQHYTRNGVRNENGDHAAPHAAPAVGSTRDMVRTLSVECVVLHAARRRRCSARADACAP